MKILETERLLLRGLEQGDFKDVCKLLQDDEVMYAYEGAFNDQEVQNWLDRQFGRYRHDGFGLWGVVEKGSNELIGQCGKGKSKGLYSITKTDDRDLWRVDTS